MSGEIKKFGRKGYEAISRETLQDKRISYGATGLLCELASYESGWKLYKTELYKRRESSKRAAVDKLWNELIVAGYIVQYRKRVGKKYDHRYIFSSQQYTIEELNQIDDEMAEDGYELYLADKTIELFIKNVLNETGTIFERWTLGNLNWDVVFGMLKINTSKNADMSRFRGMLIFNSSKSASKRTSKNYNPKEDDDDYINIKGDSEDSLIDDEILDDMFADIENSIEPSESNDEYNYIHPECLMVEFLLKDSNIPEIEAKGIATAIDNEFEKLFVIEHIVAQLDFIVGKIQNGGTVFDIEKYFMIGLRKRVEVAKIDTDRSLADGLEKAYGKAKSISKPVPMYNWIEGIEEN